MWPNLYRNTDFIYLKMVNKLIIQNRMKPRKRGNASEMSESDFLIGQQIDQMFEGGD